MSIDPESFLTVRILIALVIDRAAGFFGVEWSGEDE